MVQIPNLITVIFAFAISIHNLNLYPNSKLGWGHSYQGGPAPQSDSWNKIKLKNPTLLSLSLLTRSLVLRGESYRAQQFHQMTTISSEDNNFIRWRRSHKKTQVVDIWIEISKCRYLRIYSPNVDWKQIRHNTVKNLKWNLPISMFGN